MKNWGYAKTSELEHIKKVMDVETVLVTGADGFIGSHLTEMLVKEGYKVKALSQYNSFNYWGWLEDVSCLDQIEVFNGDVRDAHYCKHITKDVDIVYHLAALIAIPYSYVAPDSYVDTNVRGTLNICQAAKENGCSRVIHTSTSEVYGTAQYVPIDEKHPLQAQSPYSASKIAADAMAMSFFNSFDLPVTIARPFNTYGPRQSARAVIPTTANIFISGLIRAPAITSSMPVGTDSILGVISLFTVFATDWTLLLVSVTKKTADSLAAVINGRSGVPFGGMVSVSSASLNRPLAPSGIFVFFL